MIRKKGKEAAKAGVGKKREGRLTIPLLSGCPEKEGREHQFKKRKGGRREGGRKGGNAVYVGHCMRHMPGREGRKGENVPGREKKMTLIFS